MGPFDFPGLERLVPDLVHGKRIEDVYAPELEAADKLESIAPGDRLASASDFFQRFYLPDDILVKVDRASMLHSLEVRCPFLDRSVVEYANSLPSSLKYRRGRTKRLLKTLLARDPDLVPKELVERKKKGFGIPAARWLRTDLKSDAEVRILDRLPRLLPLFQRSELRRLWERHQAGAENNYKELWALLMLSHWAERWRPRGI
jgi:asparagine synthase (glutamine-hydrolysing)